MTAFLAYLLSLAVVAAWFRWGPRLKPVRLLLLWWLGVLLARLVPGLIEELLGPDRQASFALLRAVAWFGSLLLLRALLGLTSWKRPPSRRRTLAASAFGVALILGGLDPEVVIPGIILAIPWLWSIRWRDELGAGGLTVASLTALLSLLLCGWYYGTSLDTAVIGEQGDGPAAPLGGIARGAMVFRYAISIAALVYSALALPRTATRIHLSIRRIRNRLLVSHLLAGVIPVVLAALFLLLAGALFLSTYRGIVTTRLLTRSSQEAESRLLSELADRRYVGDDPFGAAVEGQIVLLGVGIAPTAVVAGTPGFPPDSLLALDDSPEETPLLWDGAELYVRARADTVLDGRPYRVEALAPVDSLKMAEVSRLLGVPVRVNPSLRVMRSAGGVSVNQDDGARAAHAIGPPQPDWKQLPGGAIAHCLQWREDGWNRTAVPILSSASIGESLVALVDAGKSNPLATAVIIVLGLIAVLFLGAAWITIAMVYGMGRSIARSVRSLTHATRELADGNLSHRISVEGKDELWSVAASFNTMAGGLERMRAMELEAQRMEEELRLAHDIQKRLLPEAAPRLDGLEVAGLSLPAREVGGDYFDYLPMDDGRLGLVVADVAGKGVPAALLMSSFRASLRSQDLGQMGPAETLARLNRYVCSSVDPGRFITVFLAILDARAGELRFAQAGHEPPLLLHPGNGPVDLSGGDGLVLGVNPRYVYEEAAVRLEPGALLAVYTDGVTEAQSPGGDFYGKERFAELLQEGCRQDCDELLRRIMRELQAYAGIAAQSDDITVVLARKR
ncbi:MAG: SpoIIE family protein phosphatase [Candidatus Eisenbacteria bacterium]|nr:SpoIIE family protein phosphatase [Candidatus Eisenbacteria bacterium]